MSSFSTMYFCNQNLGSTACHHKNQIGETDASEKRKRFISVLASREGGRLFIQSPSLQLSAGRTFIGREKESRTESKGEGLWTVRQYPCWSQYGFF